MSWVGGGWDVRAEFTGNHPWCVNSASVAGIVTLIYLDREFIPGPPCKRILMF